MASDSTWHLVYADMALTITDYIWNEHNIQFEASGINVLEMEIPKSALYPSYDPTVLS